MFAAFPDLYFSLEDMLTEEDKVAYRYTLRATHSGSWRGAPPTGKSITVTGTSITRITDGKSAELWSNTDALGLLQQLGVAPAPGQAS
jgi:predicted ester cyclase